MKKILSVLLIILFLSALAGVILYFFPQVFPQGSDTVRHWISIVREKINPQPVPGGPTYRVIRAIDGDTLLVSINEEEISVRLIGVDAPESVHPEAEKNTPEGEQASQWMKEYISGKTVSLEYDQELTDRYGRTLAYVYVDGILLEDVLLNAGMARTMKMNPNTKYERHFEQIEKIARRNRAGFWGTGFYENG